MSNESVPKSVVLYLARRKYDSLVPYDFFLLFTLPDFYSYKKSWCIRSNIYVFDYKYFNLDFVELS